VQTFGNGTLTDVAPELGELLLEMEPQLMFLQVLLQHILLEGKAHALWEVVELLLLLLVNPQLPQL
jgi:hypothetical protein